MRAPDLTIIVVSFNSRATIAACLDALQHQTVVGFRTLVIDSSSDGTAELVARDYPDIELLHSAKRLFPGDARNLGMRQVTTPLAGFVDADCVANHDWWSA